MSLIYMAVDKNKIIHDVESKEWLKRGISSIRVDTMNEGIERLISNKFLFISINSDNINYMPKLQIMREVTHDPILIATTKFTMKEQTKALYNGADVFAQIEDPVDNIESILSILHRLDERSKQRKKSTRIVCERDILMWPDYHKVFIHENEIKLTKIEFDLLYFFMRNRGRVLNWRQIYRHVWKNNNFEESAHEIVKSAIRRLRNKISNNKNDNSLIENLWGIGYKLPTDIE